MDRALDRRVSSGKRASDKVFEYACHEGNYALGNIMRGARLLEADHPGSSGD